ncbi:MAG: TCP-1/cpn60 chaperonin family protein [Candidatus Aenigmarchaeota archaeon]|nr:TCP-1/cpn60 chaperonin family protein [Candidatus Aenigmarchaeota archaeon]
MVGFAQMGGQPIFILPEGTLRSSGKDAQSRNIAAAKAVAESIRTTLGPKGMDKMLVDTIGDVTITNDGATILREMEIEHPAAKMLVEVAKTQEDEVGDGTTTAVVLAGELLKKAESLIEQDIHPSVILRGYRDARKKSLEVLGGLSEDISITDEDTLKKIAMTAMTGKSGETARDNLAAIAVAAVKMVAEGGNGRPAINRDDIKIEKKQGGSMDDSELIKGIVIDKEVVHANMPKRVKEAKIALLDCALEVKETENNAEIRITSPDQLQAFLDQESKMLKEMVRKAVASGCNVVFCQKGIDDLAQHYLAKEKILAARRVKKSDMEVLAKATGANVVSNVDELRSEDLGRAGLVEEQKIAGEEMIFVRDCKDPKAVSILIRGGTEHVVDEAKRAMDDAVLGLAAAIEDGKIVPGGGAVEIELARRLREYAETVGGREQLAINAFAEAVEIIPRTLAESTGKDPIDILVNLRTQHEKDNKSYGVDVINGSVADMKRLGVVEPLRIKTQAIKSAGEAAELILRIDDVITAKSGGGPGGGMPKMPGGDMGDMGDME